MNKDGIQEALKHYARQLQAIGTPPKENPSIRCALFDMDGVLYDSMPTHAVAWIESMSRFGLKMTNADAYATEGARGIDTIRVFAKKQLGKDLTHEEAQKMYDVKTQCFHQYSEPKIFPGVIDLMRKMKSAGVTIGVVTGSGQRPLLERLRRDFGEFVKEEHIVSAYDVKRGKPYPDPYLAGLKKCGPYQPWQGLVIENAPLGVRAGVAAHIFTVAVNSGPLPDFALTAEGANLLYHKMTEFCTNWDQLIKLFSKLAE